MPTGHWSNSGERSFRFPFASKPTISLGLGTTGRVMLCSSNTKQRNPSIPSVLPTSAQFFPTPLELLLILLRKRQKLTYLKHWIDPLLRFTQLACRQERFNEKDARRDVFGTRVVHNF